MSERVLAGVGHFPHEERPGEFNRLLLDWLAGL
jgi:pimeloyl-ACP methyl ester carboxylesterase